MERIKRLFFWLLKYGSGLVLGLAVGFAAGYLRYPVVEDRNAFWAGLAVGIFVMLSLVAVLWLGIGKSRLGQASSPDGIRPSKFATWMRATLAFLIVGGIAAGAWAFYRQHQTMEEQARQHRRNYHHQEVLNTTIKNSHHALLMGPVLDQVQAELASSGERGLRDATIARVAALSNSLQPYHYLEGDSLSTRKWSPERGHLLLALVAMNIDSTAFAQLKQATTFAGADLSGAHLAGADLSGANLEGARLRDTDLRDADLRRACLRYASCWGARFDSARLQGAELIRADLRWAELPAARLDSAVLNGADLRNATLTLAGLRGARIRYAQCGGAIFQAAVLSGGDLLGTGMAKADLRRADLSGANMRLVNLSDAHLEGADWMLTRVGKVDWAQTMAEWQRQEVGGLELRFAIVQDTTKPLPFEAAFLLQPLGAGK